MKSSICVEIAVTCGAFWILFREYAICLALDFWIVHSDAPHDDDDSCDTTGAIVAPDPNRGETNVPVAVLFTAGVICIMLRNVEYNY